MPFNNLQYVLLLLAVALLSRVIPSKLKTSYALICSLLFIAWINVSFLYCILAIIFASYLGGLAVGNSAGFQRKIIFAFSIGISLSFLLVFKYTETLIGQYYSLASMFDRSVSKIELNLLLPIGISYYVFQSIGYMVEVYLKNEEAETNFINFALFLSFMPKLMAGPIERSHSFLPQIRNYKNNKLSSIHDGLFLIFQGAIKKLIIADWLTDITSPIYSDVSSYSGAFVVIISFLFVFQVYTDLSGYTDIALGAGKLFGFQLTDNFNKPFHATSVADFWRRWHISLSSWVADYVYRPLSLFLTVQKGWNIFGIMVALLLSFALIGLWHGEKMTYLVFGLIQAAAIGVELVTKPLRKYFHVPQINMPGNIWVLSVFAFSCTFFAADSMDHAYSILHQMGTWGNMEETIQFVEVKAPQLSIVVVFAILNEMVFRQSFIQKFKIQSATAKLTLFSILAILILMCSAIEQTPFIYQRF